MSVERVLNHLVREVPKAIDRAGLPPNACILASRLGLEVLRAEKIRARPLAVRLRVANAPYAGLISKLESERDLFEEPDLVEEAKQAGAWCVAIGFGGTSSGWDGHLVLTVQDKYLLDLTAGQVERLRRGIHAEAFWAIAPELSRGERWGGRNDEDGCVWIYDPNPADKSFIMAPAWSGYRISVRKDRVISERYGPRPEGAVATVTIPLP